MSKARITVQVERTSEAGRVEEAVQLLRTNLPAMYLAEHFSRVVPDEEHQRALPFATDDNIASG